MATTERNANLNGGALEEMVVVVLNEVSLTSMGGIDASDCDDKDCGTATKT